MRSAASRLMTMVLVLLVASLTAGACGRGDKDASARTASPSAPAVKVLGPLQRDGVLIEEPPSTSFFVVEVDTGEVYAIQSAVPGEGLSGVRWLDDDSLLVKAEHGEYEVSLDGRVTLVPSTPAPIPTPRTCVCGIIDCSICDGPLLSPDHDWMATQERGAYGQIVVRSVWPLQHGALLQLNSADAPAWAPVGHLVAFNGNLCAGFDIFLFDPASQLLTNLTTSLQGLALKFLWRPNASGMAVEVVPPVKERALGLIDVRTGDYTELVRVRAYGGLRPLEWSPDGSTLLFVHVGGGGFCEGVGQPGVPTPAPTTLEVLAADAP